MAKSVITIPATRSSYDAQVDYYTNYINGREDREFVSVYAEIKLANLIQRAKIKYQGNMT